MPEGFRQITSYLPEGFRQITSSLKLRKEELEEEDLYDIDNDNPQVQAFRNNYDKVCNAVSDKHKLLMAKDKELGLYILAPNKVKESICYPEIFSGHMGENVFKFVSEFKSCIEADQVRVKDEVKTLRKYLAEDALICVGENTPSLDDALETLIATFGDTNILWKIQKKTLCLSLGKKEDCFKPFSSA